MALFYGSDNNKVLRVDNNGRVTSDTPRYLPRVNADKTRVNLWLLAEASCLTFPMRLRLSGETDNLIVIYNFCDIALVSDKKCIS